MGPHHTLRHMPRLEPDPIAINRNRTPSTTSNEPALISNPVAANTNMYRDATRSLSLPSSALTTIATTASVATANAINVGSSPRSMKYGTWNIVIVGHL